MDWTVTTKMPTSVKVKGTKIKNYGYNRYRARFIERIVHDIAFHYGRACSSGYIIYQGEKVRVFLHDVTWKCEEMLNQDIRDEQLRDASCNTGRWVESYGRDSA